MTLGTGEERRDSRLQCREPESPKNKRKNRKVHVRWSVLIAVMSNVAFVSDQKGGDVEDDEENKRQTCEGVDELPGWAANLRCEFLAQRRMDVKE